MHHIHKEAVCFGLEKESTVSLFGLLPSPHRTDRSSLWSPFTFPRTLTTLDNLTMVPGAVTLQTQLWEPENVRDRSGVPGRRRRDHSLSVGRRRGPGEREQGADGALCNQWAAREDRSARETLFPCASEKGPHQWRLVPRPQRTLKLRAGQSARKSRQLSRPRAQRPLHQPTSYGIFVPSCGVSPVSEALMCQGAHFC